MVKLVSLEYNVDVDSNGTKTLSLYDKTDWNGAGNFSLNDFSQGLSVIFINNSNYNDAYVNVPNLSGVISGTYISVGAFPQPNTFNNKHLLVTLPLHQDDNTAYFVTKVVLPRCDTTLNVRTTFKAGDLFVDIVAGNFVVFQALVDNANPTISGEVTDNIGDIPSRFLNPIYQLLVGNYTFPLPEFQANFQTLVNCGSGFFEFSDTSNYSNNTPVVQFSVFDMSMFSDYTKLYVTGPNQMTIQPVSGSPNPSDNGYILFQLPFDSFGGDGLYELKFINVPTFSSLCIYPPQYVVSVGEVLYQNQQGGETSDLNDFTVITEDQLPSRYVSIQSFVTACEIIECSNCSFTKAFCGNCGNCEHCCENSNFIKTVKTAIILDYLNNGFTNQEKQLDSYKSKVNQSMDAINYICQY